MHAVPRCGLYYGLVRTRPRSSHPRRRLAHILRRIETAMPAVPGLPAPLKALTVARSAWRRERSCASPAVSLAWSSANRPSSVSHLCVAQGRSSPVISR
jgi:hypothetical protein